MRKCDLSCSKVTINFFILMFVSVWLTACGGGGGGGNGGVTVLPPVTTSPQTITGAGVKGPLSNAEVTVYGFDASQADFKGAVIDTASTDNSAAIVGLALPLPLSPPYIMEFTSTSGVTVDLTTGKFPVISTLRTVITQALLDTGDQIYATPLTTMATDIAISNADSSTAPYAGNNDGRVTEQEFLNALPAAAAQLASALGFGVSGNIDFFDTPPIIDSTTITAAQLTAVAQYRTAIEALTALVAELAQNVANPTVSIDIMLNELTEDLADGVIDGLKNGNASTIIDSTVLTALPTINISTLAIPNSDNGAGQPLTVDGIEALLISEQSVTGSTVDASVLTSITITPQNVTPQNNAPIATADVNSVQEDSAINTVTGNLLNNDIDTGALTVTNATSLNNTGVYGTLSISADGAYSYVLDNTNGAVDALNTGETLTDSFDYVVSDGLLTDNSTLVITINGVTDGVAGSVDVSGVWLLTSTVLNETPIGCAGGINSVEVSAATIAQTGNNLTVKASSGAVLTGTIDTITGDFDLPTGTLSRLSADLTQVANASAFVDRQFSFSASGIGVTATSLNGTVNTTETLNGETICVYSENLQARFAYQHQGTENYDGIYAFEFFENRLESDGVTPSQDIRFDPITFEMEFTPTDVKVHFLAPSVSPTNTLSISDSLFEPTTGFFTFTVNEKFRISTDADPATIEASETSNFIVTGIFMNDPAVNAGANGEPLIMLSTDGYHRDFIGDVDAGGAAIRAGNDLSTGYAKRLATESRTRTRLVKKADLSTEMRIIMGLNNSPLKRVDTNSNLFMEVLDGSTVLCSERYLKGDVSSGGYNAFKQFPFTLANFFGAEFRGNTYSNIRCNTSDPITAADQVVDGRDYTIRVLDSGVNGLNDAGTGDDVIAFTTAATASVVAPAERYTQVINVFDITVNGIHSANPTTTGENVRLPGYYNINRSSTAVITWPVHPEGADSYQLRIEPTGTGDSIMRVNTGATAVTANIGETGNKVRALRLIARKNADSNGARAQAGSRRLLIANGISGAFAFDLGNGVDPAYRNMQITLQGDGSVGQCTVDNNINVSCNSDNSVIDFNREVVSLNMTDNTGTLVGVGNTFTLEMNFFRNTGSAVAVVTSPDGISGIPVTVAGAATTAVLIQ